MIIVALLCEQQFTVDVCQYGANFLLFYTEL